MNIIDVTFYDFTTGELGRIASLPFDSVDAELGPNEGYVVGHFSGANKRVDPKTEQVIDYQPPKPSDEHEWDVTEKRWLLTEEVKVAIVEAQEAQVEVQDLEKDSLRALREVLLQLAETTKLPPSQALTALKAVDNAVAAERPKLQPRGR